jgi:hypothetical protein
MPIHLNLLAEDLELEEMRRKNPVKRALWVSGFVVFLVLLWGLTLFLKIVVVKSEVSALDSKWREMEKNVKQVEDDRKRKRDVERRLSALLQFTTNRFLWANAMNALQQTWVENAQLVRLKAEQNYLQSEPVKAPVGPAASGAAPAKPAVASERIVVYLDGRDYGARVGEQVPRYKESLLAFPFFQAHLQKTNSILLTSLSAPQTDPAKKTAFVQFGLQLNFQEKERRLYE